MSIKVEITDLVPELQRLFGKVDSKNVFPKLSRAMDAITQMWVMTWREFASGKPIPGSSKTIHSRGDYIRSIQSDVSKPDEKIAFTDSPHHKLIEEGHGEIDLKPGLLRGQKARMGKDGPYNIVAFRHGIPGTNTSNRPMPVNVYAFMKDVQQSFVTGKKVVQGQVRNTYSWGSTKLPESMGGNRELKRTSVGDYEWKTGKHTAMVRMAANTAKAKSSSYITFRVVSFRSDPASWIVPERQGILIRQAVVDFTRPFAENLIRKAIEEDFK